MKILILLLLSTIACADETDRAIETSQQAVLAYPEVQQLQKTLTNKLEAVIPLPKEYATPIATLTITAIKGKIDTKSFKYNYVVFGGNFRPDSSYNLKNDEIRISANINWAY